MKTFHRPVLAFIVLFQARAVCFQTTSFFRGVGMKRFTDSQQPAFLLQSPRGSRRDNFCMTQSRFDASEGIDDWITRSAIKAQQLEYAKNLQVDLFTSEYAELKNQVGSSVPPKSLRGTSVALYFAAANCDQCREFTHALSSFYDAHNKAKGDDPSVNVIFVSCDSSEEEAKSHFDSMHPNWLMLDYGCQLRQVNIHGPLQSQSRC